MLMPALDSFEAPLHVLVISSTTLVTSTLVRGTTALSMVGLVMTPVMGVGIVVTVVAVVLVIAATVTALSTHTTVMVVAPVTVRVGRTRWRWPSVIKFSSSLVRSCRKVPTVVARVPISPSGPTVVPAVDTFFSVAPVACGLHWIGSIPRLMVVSAWVVPIVTVAIRLVSRRSVVPTAMVISTMVSWVITLTLLLLAMIRATRSWHTLVLVMRRLVVLISTTLFMIAMVISALTTTLILLLPADITITATTSTVIVIPTCSCSLSSVLMAC